MTTQLCEFLSGAWFQVLHRISAPRSSNASMELVLDGLASRQVQLEMQDRRCVCEARRFHSLGAKVLFRSKMLEHRRIQAQLLQLQRFRDNVQAQMDAMSNQEINRAFVDAMQSAIKAHKGGLSNTREAADEAIKDIGEAMATANEITELLGQPMAEAEEVDDDDLVQELMLEPVVDQIRMPSVPARMEQDDRPLLTETPRLVIPLAAALS